jgi:hypothetical protein
MVTFDNLVLVSTIHYSTFSMPFSLSLSYAVFILSYQFLSYAKLILSYLPFISVHVCPVLSAVIMCHFYAVVIPSVILVPHLLPVVILQHALSVLTAVICIILLLTFQRTSITSPIPAYRHHIDQHSSGSIFRHTTACSSIQS